MTIQVGLHHRSVHIPVKPKTQAKPNCENTCTKESMKYLARIIVYWTKPTSGPVFLLERSGNFTYYCCCTCLLVFQ